MRLPIPVIAATRWDARALSMGKSRSARPWRFCLALAGFACAILLSVPCFAQNPPLNFGNNFFVTGDYVVAGAYGMTTNFSNGYAVGTFVVPDTNPGIHAPTYVPLGAEVVGALVYWQTVENAGTVPGQPGTGENGFFRPLIPNGPPAPGHPMTGVSLPGQNAVSWSSGGCSEPQAGKITRTYRANVLGAFPQDAKGNILANGEFEIRLPSVGPSTPLTLGATLVIIYRVLSPNVPLNSIVIYDGAFGQSDVALNMTQTVQGFYDADHHPVSKLTLIAGAGKSNKYQTVYLNNEALPSHSGRNLPPFPGYYGDWDNPTWTFGNPFYPEIANPVLEDAASATTEVVPSANGPGCLSWGAVILSTTVKNTGNDGLLDSWKKAGGYCDASINGGACNQGNNSDPAWVALPGATVGKKDLFIQLDYMCSQTTGIDSCQTGDGTNYSFDPRPSGAVSMMTQAFSSHGVTVHVNPPGTIQPVHAIEEQNCSDLPGPPLALCTFPDQAGVVGWKGGYAYFKNQFVETSNGNAINCLGANPAADCQPRFQHGRKDSWHYALFAHAVGRTEWKLQGGTLASVVQSGNTVTFTTSTPLGTLTNGGYDNHGNILPDPSCLNGRVSIYYAATNTNLNGTFCINSSTAPAGETFTIIVPGSPASAHYTLSTDPYLSVAPGQTGSASGVSDVGGADSLITLGLWGDPTSASSNGRQVNTMAGTFMHETGHSLGLTHGGFYYDNGLELLGIYTPTIEPNCKPNFQSVMNYFFQVDLLNGALDYSEQQLDSLDEASLPAGVTYHGGPPLYPSTKWYTPIPPQGVGSRVTSHCDGTPPLPSDPVTFLVPGAADPTSPAWDRPKSDVDFDGIITSQSPYLRGYSDWAPGGSLLTGFTTGIDLRQIGATGNISVFSQANFFGGGINVNGGGISLNGGGISLNGGGQSLDGGGINVNGGGISLNGGGISLNGGGISLNGGGEIDQKTADSYTRPLTGLAALEGTSPRTITLTWTAPTFGQIGTYRIYRSSDGGKTFALVASVNGNPPVTTYTDTVTCDPTGYQYFATAVLSSTSTNPGQESVPSNIVSTTPPSLNPLTGCYTLTAISLSTTTAVQGSLVPMTWSLADDFYTTGTVVSNLKANTLVAIGPGGRTTLLSQGAVTAQGGVSTFGFSNNQFTFNWDSDPLPAGSYTFELDLDSGQLETTTTPVQLSIDVNDTDSTPHITTTVLPPGTVGSLYSYPLTQDGGTPTLTWTIASGSLPLGVSLGLNSGALFGTTCVAGPSSFMVKVTDSKSNSGTQGLTLQINQANTTTNVSSNANPAVYGQIISFTVSVAPNSPCTPTGTVTLSSDGAPIGSNSLSSGTATFTTSLPVGTHNITATYGGDGNFIGSTTSAPLVQVVNKAITTTGQISSVNPSVFGQAVTFTATVGVVSPGAGVPTGMVNFYDGVNPIPIGSGSVTAGGVASFTTSALAVAAHNITATYSGDGNFVTSSSAPLMQVVNKASTTTSVGSSPNPSVFGQAVTFTATTNPVLPGAGVPTGVVNFSDNGTLIGSSQVNAAGVASFTTFALAAATHNITATYSGDGNFVGSASASFSQVVNQASTTTSVGSSLNPSVFGQAVTFTATVVPTFPGAGMPTGMVSFSDGATVFGSNAVNGAGVASLTTSALAAGAHNITATYAGDLSFLGSTSTALSQTVTPAPLTAIVTGTESGGPPPTTFTVGTVNYSGFVSPDTSSVVTGTLSCTVSMTADAAGNYPISCSGLTASNYSINYSYSVTPSARRTVLATDPSGNVVLFGGSDGVNNLADTWVWNGTTWMQQVPATSPPARNLNGMVLDPSLNETVLFGGTGAVGYNDTWTWNGTTWTQVSPSGGPPSQRFAFGMDYDVAANAVVIFGGYTVNGPAIDDTWELAELANNSLTYTQLQPTTSPSPICCVAMAFDPPSSSTLLFGGTVPGLGYLQVSDTWRLQGGQWTLLSSLANAPSARSGAAMVYDPATSTIVLFGGTSASGDLNDTWIWNGATLTWTQASPSTSPPARRFDAQGMAYDPNTQTVVMFGGFAHNTVTNTDTPLGDTWSWNGSTWVQQVQQTAPLTVTVNGTQPVGGTPTFTATYSGFINGDTLSVVTGTLSCITGATTASPAGSYPIMSCSGLSAPNTYSIAYAYGTVSVQ